MPKKVEELSAIEVKRISGRGLHAVGGVSGLCLSVAKGGARSWILRARIGSKRRSIGLGGYPDVTLSRAKAKARETRELILEGIDPVARREAARQALIAAQAKQLTFAEAAHRKHASISHEFRNPKHAKQWLSSLERHAFPAIGEMDVADIELAHVLEVLNPIWKTKTETASRVRQRIESVLSWATVAGHRKGNNPAAWRGNLSEVLPAAAKIRKRKHQRALPWQEVPSFMDVLRQRSGTGARALEFAILTASRSGEVRGMTWEEVDFNTGIWNIPAERMKAGKAHKVPLPPRAVEIIKQQPRMADSQYVFAAKRGGKLSDMSLSAVTRRMEVDAVPHGFRSSFKDWARNRTGFADEVSELALAHVNNDSTRAAYARDSLLQPRAKLMQQWARYCTEPFVEGSSISDIGEARA